jgi:hypothetical protein
VSGAGVFRFQDGSLLKVNFTQAGGWSPMDIIIEHMLKS